jgi:hypothetical protein
MAARPDRPVSQPAEPAGDADTDSDPVEVVYLTDASGAIYRVWMLTPSEASVSRSR